MEFSWDSSRDIPAHHALGVENLRNRQPGRARNSLRCMRASHTRHAATNPVAAHVKEQRSLHELAAARACGQRVHRAQAERRYAHADHLERVADVHASTRRKRRQQLSPRAHHTPPCEQAPRPRALQDTRPGVRVRRAPLPDAPRKDAPHARNAHADSPVCAESGRPTTAGAKSAPARAGGAPRRGAGPDHPGHRETHAHPSRARWAGPPG